MTLAVRYIKPWLFLSILWPYLLLLIFAITGALTDTDNWQTRIADRILEFPFGTLLMNIIPEKYSILGLLVIIFLNTLLWYVITLSVFKRRLDRINFGNVFYYLIMGSLVLLLFKIIITGLKS